MSEVQRVFPIVPQIQDGPRTTMDMVQEAISRGASVEMVKELLGLHKEWEASQARKAFDRAISAAKAKIPVIIKRRSGTHSTKYEDMGAIAEAVAPILSEHGLSYRFRTEQANGQISVFCILSHREGHSEETMLSAAADTGPGRNAIQAIGSAVTYLQRYTLKAALGLAAAADDDGASSAKEDGPISDAQLQELITLADKVGADKRRFCEYFNVDSFADIRASQFQKAKQAIEAKRKKAANA